MMLVGVLAYALVFNYLTFPRFTVKPIYLPLPESEKLYNCTKKKRFCGFFIREAHKVIGLFLIFF